MGACYSLSKQSTKDQPNTKKVKYPLHHAVETGNFALLCDHLTSENCPDPNQADDAKNTALDIAVMNRRFDFAEILVVHYNRQQASENGCIFTPLHLLVTNIQHVEDKKIYDQYLKLIELLIKKDREIVHAEFTGGATIKDIMNSFEIKDYALMEYINDCYCNARQKSSELLDGILRNKAGLSNLPDLTLSGSDTLSDSKILD